MRMSRYTLYFLLFSIFSPVFQAVAQNRDHNLVQFSGIIVTADNLQPVPYCDIIVRKTGRGTISDFNGYFSFVAKKGDVIDFSALGFRTTSYTIPDTLKRDHYSLIQVMTSDTLLLAESVIYPWPTIEQFKEAFINFPVPDDDLTIAQRNLNREDMKERIAAMPMDGSMNFRNTLDKQTYKLYYIGQTTPNNLLNPIAWAQFIKAWREGKLKNPNKK
jgi:hypothetical protein